MHHPTKSININLINRVSWQTFVKLGSQVLGWPIQPEPVELGWSAFKGKKATQVGLTSPQPVDWKPLKSTIYSTLYWLRHFETWLSNQFLGVPFMKRKGPCSRQQQYLARQNPQRVYLPKQPASFLGNAESAMKIHEGREARKQGLCDCLQLGISVLPQVPQPKQLDLPPSSFQPPWTRCIDAVWGHLSKHVLSFNV